MRMQHYGYGHRHHVPLRPNMYDMSYQQEYPYNMGRKYKTGTAKIVWGFILLALGLLTAIGLIGLGFIAIAIMLLVSGFNDRNAFLNARNSEQQARHDPPTV